MQKVYSPSGEEYEVAEEATDRIISEGVPFIMVDIKEQKFSIKEGPLFFYCNLEGNISTGNTSGLGLYYKDTRFLSCYELKINGRDPVLLSSSAERDYMSHVELTNADIWQGDRLLIPQETLNIRRIRAIKEALYERIRIKNYNAFPVDLQLEFNFSVDFADIFEVRGQRRLHRGKLLQPKVADSTLKLAYVGQDEVFRQTQVQLSRPPTAVKVALEKTTLLYNVHIRPHGRFLLNLEIQPVVDGEVAPTVDFNTATTILRRSYGDWERSCTDIYTDNELFNSMVYRGKSDLRSLLNRTPQGAIFDAGIPWFVATFGRDSLITSVESMILNPTPVRETLRLLARLQGTENNDWKDEQPGKILHEIRLGELANLQEIPHTPYYGSVDSTPLFIIAAAEYLQWTGDRELVEELKPNLEAALEWIDTYGDLDGDGFVEYERRSKRGLINQGWKDSYNAVVHADGTLAKPPIALAEVQGYIYFAKVRGADLFASLGDLHRAEQLRKQAEELRQRFNRAFWLEDEGYYAMALDGEKTPVTTVTSNPAQCLWTGMMDRERADRVRRRLFQPDMFSGWGIRTMSKAAVSYNPMSYHNGSVWPHDNALIAAGLKRYGFNDAVGVVASSLFDVAMHYPYYRLPELFCGFTRRGDSWPVSYPVACSPQAWAAGAMFLLLQSILGIFPNAPANTVHIVSPSLPGWLNKVYLTRLRIGGSELDVVFTREREATNVTVLRKEGSLRVLMEEQGAAQ